MDVIHDIGAVQAC